MPFYPFGAQQFYLGSSCGSTDTSILLSSFTEPVSGTPYTMSYLNTSIVYGTIAPQTTSSEFISFTGITQNANGSALLTGVTRGLKKAYPFTSSSTFQLAHPGQSVFIISDAPQLFQEYVPINNDVTIYGLVTFNQNPLGINPGGVPNASTTVAGITKLDTAPASPTSPIAVGLNSALLTTLSGTATSLTNKIVDSSSLATSKTNNAVVQANSSGFIDNTFLQLGTTANKILQLDGSAKIPAVDGSQLTNLPDTAKLGTWTSAGAGGGAQAATDGFVILSMTYVSSSATILSFVTDSNPSPSTVRGIICVTSSSTNNNQSLTCPVKKNDYYAWSTTGSGSVTIVAYFIPIGT